MKKSLFAICMAAIMLTGCGNAATSGESTANTSSKADTASSAVSDDESKDDVTDSQGDDTFYDLYGIDFPVPGEMSEFMKASGRNLRCWCTTYEPNDYHPLDYTYYALDVYIDDEYQDVSKGHTLEELPDLMLTSIDDQLYTALESSTNGKAERKTVESQTEEEFMGVPALCEKGTITTYEDLKVNYIVHYAYIDNFTSSGREHCPTFWLAFTASDDKDAIDLMNKAADLPLTKAKLHE